MLDRETGTYADHTKVRPINFAGKYYKCRGPLNTSPLLRAVQPSFRRAARRADASSPPNTRTASLRLPPASPASRLIVTMCARGLPPLAATPTMSRCCSWLPQCWARRRKKRTPRFRRIYTSPGYIEKALAADRRHHRHRLLEVRSRCRAAAPHHQWRAGFARCLRPMGQRQDTATALHRAGVAEDSMDWSALPTRWPTVWAWSWRKSAATGS